MTKQEKVYGATPEHILRAFADRNRLRPTEKYGDIRLSVQASETHYAKPRVSGLDIDNYELVEVGVLSKGGILVRPSDIGIPGFDDEFETGAFPVAGYVSQEWVSRLREALKGRMNNEKNSQGESNG